MRKYEIMFIIKPTLSEDDIAKVADSFKKTLESLKTTVTAVDSWGQRPLAYDIKMGSEEHKSGYYYVYQVESEDDAGIKEFERLSRISPDMIRHLIIRKED